MRQIAKDTHHRGVKDKRWRKNDRERERERETEIYSERRQMTDVERDIKERDQERVR